MLYNLIKLMVEEFGIETVIVNLQMVCTYKVEEIDTMNSHIQHDAWEKIAHELDAIKC